MEIHMFQVQSLYPEELVAPMRKELTTQGVKELRTVDEVDTELADHSGTTLVIINSVCGCAAGMARPAAIKALQHDVLPEKVTTVFPELIGKQPKKSAHIFWDTLLHRHLWHFLKMGKSFILFQGWILKPI